MDPRKLYINCHGFEIKYPKKFKERPIVPGVRLQKPAYRNMEGDAQSPQEVVVEAPEVPKRTFPNRKSKDIPILYCLLGASFMLWTVLTILAFFYYSHSMERQQKHSMEIQELWKQINTVTNPKSSGEMNIDELKCLSKAIKSICEYIIQNNSMEGKLEEYCFIKRTQTKGEWICFGIKIHEKP